MKIKHIIDKNTTKESLLFRSLVFMIALIIGVFFLRIDLDSPHFLIMPGTPYMILLLLVLWARSKFVLISLGVLFTVFLSTGFFHIDPFDTTSSELLMNRSIVTIFEEHHEADHVITLMLRLIGVLAIVSMVVLGTLFLRKSELVEDYLHNLSIKDPLTGVYSRRYFFEMLKQSFRKAVRNSGHNFSIIIMDIDHFRQVNETFLHQGGDVALKSLCQHVGNVIRDIDVFGRYGGEEFLIILPNTDMKNAVVLAERIRIAVEKMEVIYKNQRIPITISLGVSDYDTFKYTGLEEMLRTTDRALYRAKQNGRNQVQQSTDDDLIALQQEKNGEGDSPRNEDKISDMLT